MVMSYQGKRAETVKKPSTTVVKDYMTKKLITFKPQDHMEMVIQTLISKRISGAPVVDDQGKLVGVISEGDCLKEVVKGKYTNMPNNTGQVQDHMTRNVHTMTPDIPILEAASRFLELKIRRFPIVEDGKLIGLFSQSDVLRATDSLKSETWSE